MFLIAHWAGDAIDPLSHCLQCGNCFRMNLHNGTLDDYNYTILLVRIAKSECIAEYYLITGDNFNFLTLIIENR